MNVYLVSYESLVKAAELNSNISAERLRPIIKEVQEMRIQPLTGTNLFNKLIDGVNSNNLGADYKTLLNDYVKDVIVYYVLADLPYRMKYKFTNVSFLEQTAENTTPVNSQDVKQISEFYQSKAVWYADRLVDYLKANESKFAEYTTTQAADGIAPTKGQYKTSIYLG